MSRSLQSHWLQHARLLCPSLSSRVCSKSCPLSLWCYPTILPSATLISLCLQSFPVSFPMSQFFHIRWAKHWNFSFPKNTENWNTGKLKAGIFSLSNEYSGLVSFRIDWFGLLAVQGALKTRLQYQSSKASISAQLSLWSNSHIYTGLLEKP